MTPHTANSFGTGPASNVASATPSGSLPAPVNAAAFVSQAVPSSMSVGQSYPVTVTLRNTGTSVWTAAGLYRLGSQSPSATVTTGQNRHSVKSRAMNIPKFPVEFFFTVYDDPHGDPLDVDHNLRRLVAGAVFTGKVRVYVGWRDVNGVPDDREDDLLSPADLGLLLGDGPPRPAEDVRAMNSQGVIIGGFSWDIDTRKYADGPHTLTVGDATWVRHYPDSVAAMLAGGETISLSVVVANGGTDPGSER